MLKKIGICFSMLIVLLLSTSSFAEVDTNRTFILAVGSVLAAQNQDVEDITSTFHLGVLRPIPRIPWHIYGMAQYSRIQAPGEDDVDVDGRLIVFSSDPNGPERDGIWIAFVTLGGLQFYNNDKSNDSRLIPTNTDGSFGVIGPVLGFNLVVELGVKRQPNPLGKTETYWALGVGFLGVPKLQF